MAEQKHEPIQESLQPTKVEDDKESKEVDLIESSNQVVPQGKEELEEKLEKSPIRESRASNETNEVQSPQKSPVEKSTLNEASNENDEVQSPPKSPAEKSKFNEDSPIRTAIPGRKRHKAGRASEDENNPHGPNRPTGVIPHIRIRRPSGFALDRSMESNRSYPGFDEVDVYSSESENNNPSVRTRTPLTDSFKEELIKIVEGRFVEKEDHRTFILNFVENFHNTLRTMNQSMSDLMKGQEKITSKVDKIMTELNSQK